MKRAPSRPPRLRVAAIGWPNEQRVALLNQLGYVYRAGGEAILIVADRAAWEPIARPIRVIEVSGARALSPIDRFVAVPPRRWALGVLGLWRAGRKRSWGSRLIWFLLAYLGVSRQSGHRPRWWSRWTATAFYADTRGWAYWEAFRPHLSDIHPATLDHVLFRDVSAWATAWHLTRENPEVRVGASVSAAELAAFAAARQRWLRSQPGWWYRPVFAWLKFLPIRVVRSRPVKWSIGKLPRGLKDKVKSLLSVA